MGQDWVPAPPHNIPGVTDLAHPLQSSHGAPIPAGLADHFIAKAPVGSITARVPVLMSAAPWALAAPAGLKLTEVLRTTFPVAQPCTLVIGSDVPAGGQYPRPRRIAFLDRRNNADGVSDNLTGAIFVEWGNGPARQRLWLDIGQHTLQLPVTGFVGVSAYVGGAQGEGFTAGQRAAEVSALLIPGHTLNADARCTFRLLDRTADGPASMSAHAVPPFARRFTFAGVANFATTATLRLFDAQAQPLASYSMALGAAPAAQVPDNSAHAIPLPGGSEFFDLASTPAAAALQNMSALVAFEVAP